jgi:hypothetical protein
MRGDGAVAAADGEEPEFRRTDDVPEEPETVEEWGAELAGESDDEAT